MTIRCIVSMLSLVALVLSASSAFAQTQPVAYSHKIHIANGLACLDCHSTADVAAKATIPSVNKCMLCHAKVGVDRPEIKKVAEFAAAKREIPWVRVYEFEAHALVKFRHAPHVTKGIQCTTCHGDMANAATAQALVKHSMGTCISCHRQNGASDDCATCHY
jgi:hypothetical protein